MPPKPPRKLPDEAKAPTDGEGQPSRSEGRERRVRNHVRAMVESEKGESTPGLKGDEGSKLVVYKSATEALKAGTKPIVLFYLEQGLTSQQTSNALKEDYGIAVSPTIIEGMANRFGSLEASISVADKQQAAELRAMALDTLQSFKRRMELYEDTEDVKMFEICAREFEKWWNNAGRFVFPKDKIGQQFNVQFGDQNTNHQENTVEQLNLLLNELKDRPEEYEATVRPPSASDAGTNGSTPPAS